MGFVERRQAIDVGRVLLCNRQLDVSFVRYAVFAKLVDPPRIIATEGVPDRDFPDARGAEVEPRGATDIKEELQSWSTKSLEISLALIVLKSRGTAISPAINPSRWGVSGDFELGRTHLRLGSPGKQRALKSLGNIDREAKSNSGSRLCYPPQAAQKYLDMSVGEKGLHP